MDGGLQCHWSFEVPPNRWNHSDVKYNLWGSFSVLRWSLTTGQHLNVEIWWWSNRAFFALGLRCVIYPNHNGLFFTWIQKLLSKSPKCSDMIRDLCSSDNRLIMPQIAQMFTNAHPPIGAGKSPHFSPQIAHLLLLLFGKTEISWFVAPLWQIWRV